MSIGQCWHGRELRFHAAQEGHAGVHGQPAEVGIGQASQAILIRQISCCIHIYMYIYIDIYLLSHCLDFQLFSLGLRARALHPGYPKISLWGPLGSKSSVICQ